jgi:hypothetical protein
MSRAETSRLPRPHVVTMLVMLAAFVFCLTTRSATTAGPANTWPLAIARGYCAR